MREREVAYFSRMVNSLDSAGHQVSAIGRQPHRCCLASVTDACIPVKPRLASLLSPILKPVSGEMEQLDFGALRRHVGCAHIWRVSADSLKMEGELEMDRQQRGCSELAPSNPQAHITRAQVPARQAQLDFHGEQVDLWTGEMAPWVKCLVHKHEDRGSIPSTYVKKKKNWPW